VSHFEQLRLELGVKLAVCEPIVSTANVTAGAGFRQLSAWRRIFWEVGWWRTGDGERWSFCGRFDEEAGQGVLSVLAQRECNRRDRVALESAPSTLRQPGSRPFSDLLHVLMKYLELRVSVKG
jgi:hypothetical protein